MSKEKQIEEMAKVLYDSVNARRGKASMCDLTTDLYNAGYLKQSEGEWIVKDLKNPMYESKKAPHCSNCGYMSFIRYDYCPNCGAKMKGGAG